MLKSNTCYLSFSCSWAVWWSRDVGDGGSPCWIIVFNFITISWDLRFELWLWLDFALKVPQTKRVQRSNTTNKSVIQSFTMIIHQTITLSVLCGIYVHRLSTEYTGLDTLLILTNRTQMKITNTPLIYQSFDGSTSHFHQRVQMSRLVETLHSSLSCVGNSEVSLRSDATRPL